MWKIALQALKYAIYFGAGVGVEAVANTYVKPIIKVAEDTSLPNKTGSKITVFKIVWWVVCAAIGALIIKWLGQKLNVKLLK
jgi:hypothetical protein